MRNLRLEKIQEHIKREGIDGFIITKASNRRYSIRFTGSAGIVLVTQTKGFFLTDFRYLEQAKEEASGVEVIIVRNIRNGIKELIEKEKLQKIWFESDGIDFNTYQEWKDEFKNVKLVPMKGVVEKIRAVKTPAEISLIAKGVEISLGALGEVMKLIKPGIEEKDIAIEIEYRMRKMGAQKAAFDVIALFGERSSYPHGQPTNKKLKPGDFMLFDIGANCDGYCSDLTRTYVFSIMSSKQRAVYDIVYAAQQSAIKEVRAGISSTFVDKTAREVIEKAGYGKFFGHGLGHGVGLDVHEEPGLGQESRGILQEGMIVTIEPGIYIPGWGGIRIEDCVVVGKNGCEPLSHASKNIVCI